MAEFEIKKASRQAVKPLVGLYSESGCGKTYSALLLARGFVGPEGKIVLVDSESGRGSLYADVLPGGYDIVDLSGPFSPARYIEAVEAVERSGAKIGILDSASHEWEGLGGVLDMAGDNETRSGRAGLHNWRLPKMEHAKFMLKLLQSTIPWIICLRAKYKTRQTKGTEQMADAGIIRRLDIGKAVILKDEATSPIQADDFIFEMTAHAEILPKHNIILTKCSHPSLRECFPSEGAITVEHGQKIARWCDAAGQPMQTKAQPKSSPLKKELWEATQKIHGGDKSKLLQWLVDEALIDPETTLETMSEVLLAATIKKVKAKL